jgi:hypothetical protein
MQVFFYQPRIFFTSNGAQIQLPRNPIVIADFYRSFITNPSNEPLL